MPLWAYFVGIPVFGAMILAHEVGHYLAAKQVGIAVAEFAVGFGPRVLGVRWNGTLWTLRMLPLGGYVRWEEDRPGAFAEAPLLSRTWALLAGSLANLVLAFCLLLVLFSFLHGEGLAGLTLAGQGTLFMATGWFEAVSGLLQGSGLGDLAGPVGIVRKAGFTPGASHC